MSSDSPKITHSVLLFISQAEQIHNRSLVTHVHAWSIPYTLMAAYLA